MFGCGGKIGTFRATIAIVAGLLATQADAHTHRHGRYTTHRFGRVANVRYSMEVAGQARIIQCVAFAKQDAGILISGNARDWWSNAAGVYERGSRPEAGSVLSFRENGRMPLGHVAVVSAIEDSRTIAIDQSHWNSSGITRDIEVKDVSENNDWSAVRVQLSRGSTFGSIYPTHGFIYPRPDQGVMVANVTHAAMPVLDAAPADLRHRRGRMARPMMEVAEAPESGAGLDLTVPGIAQDAPNRALR